VNQNHSSDDNATALDLARPLADNMDQAIGEATTVMGAMVTELMRRSLRGGVVKIGEQLAEYVGERVDFTIAERRPALEQAAAAVAEQTAFTTAAKVVGEEVYALEQRTTEADRTLSGRIEEQAQGLAARIEEGDRHAIQVTQAEIGQRVQELMDKAKEGATILKARIKRVAGATAELEKQHAVSRAEITQRLDRLEKEVRDLRRANDKLTARVAELERPRGLRRLWAWLFRRGQRQQPEADE
jgi:hypothetical protein